MPTPPRRKTNTLIIRQAKCISKTRDLQLERLARKLGNASVFYLNGVKRIEF